MDEDEIESLEEDWESNGFHIEEDDNLLPSKRVWFADCPKCKDRATYLEPQEFVEAEGCLECECGHIRWPMAPQPTHSLFWPYEKE